MLEIKNPLWPWLTSGTSFEYFHMMEKRGINHFLESLGYFEILNPLKPYFCELKESRN